MKMYDVAGTIIGIDGSNVPIVEAIETIFCLCPPSEQQLTLCIKGQSCPVDHILEVIPAWLASAANRLDESPEPIFISDDNGTAVVVKHDKTIACAWLTTDHRHLQFVGGKRENRLTPLVVQPLIVPLLREVMLRKRQMLLHSAAVRCPEGTGVLIAAPGFGGKSTTTMSLVRQGAKLLGDDLTVIQPVDDQVVASGVPQPFNLTAQTIQFFPECREIDEFVAKPHPDDKKVYSPIDIYGSDCLIDKCPVSVAYFVRISTEGPTAIKMSTTEAMQNFAAAQLFARGQSLDAFSTSRLLDICSRMKVYQLKTGPNPKQLGRWLLTHAAGHEPM